MIINVQRDLTQFKDVNKSTIFLYALLQIKCPVTPIGTYMGINGCTIYLDMNLICLFHKDQEGFGIVDKELQAHKQFDFFVDEDNEYRYYVMDFSMYPETYKLIKEGKYSKLAQDEKLIINLSGNPVGAMGVSPEAYYSEFSREFNVPVDVLKKKGELLSPPDVTSEIITVPKSIIAEFQ